jgi:5-methylcytosine-specific restriction endonuclease McrA
MSCLRSSKSRKPLKRSYIKSKPKVRKERSPWLPPRIREDAKGMRRLREIAYSRSGGDCECVLFTGKRCGQKVDWFSGELHHILSRAHGGSDVIENLAFITGDCHEAVHGKLEFGKRA